MKSNTVLRKIPLIIFISAVVGGFLISMINNYIIKPYKKDRIKSDILVINGCKIISIKSIPKISDLYKVEYLYYVGNKQFKNSQKMGINFKNNGSQKLVSGAFPVACEKSDLENVQILVKPSDFEYFGLLFPDSLRWVKDDVLE